MVFRMIVVVNMPSAVVGIRKLVVVVVIIINYNWMVFWRIVVISIVVVKRPSIVIGIWKVVAGNCIMRVSVSANSNTNWLSNIIKNSPLSSPSPSSSFSLLWGWKSGVSALSSSSPMVWIWWVKVPAEQKVPRTTDEKEQLTTVIIFIVSWYNKRIQVAVIIVYRDLISWVKIQTLKIEKQTNTKKLDSPPSVVGAKGFTLLSSSWKDRKDHINCEVDKIGSKTVYVGSAEQTTYRPARREQYLG